MVHLEICDYTPGDEKRLVRILNESFGRWENEDYWRWKYLNRPGFNPQDVVTARVDEKIVGCLHSRILPIRLEPGLDVLMSFDGDFGVLSEYRGAGIAIQAHDRNDRRLLNRGVLLRGGFATREINDRFYNKRFGHVFVPSVTGHFRKIISLKPLQRKVEALGSKLVVRSWVRRALKRRPLKVDFKIDQFPAFYIEFTEAGFHFCEGSATLPDLGIRAPYSMFVSLIKGPDQLVKSFIFNLFRGRLRIRGLFRNGPYLLAQLLWGMIKR